MFFSILLSIISFFPPVNYNISLAGNFGEPRVHHFHGGIDIKTDRVENKAVLSIGSGYVSRIVVGKYGLGKAVYVKHPEGYISMFCHLNAFCPRIENILRKRQLQNKNCNIDFVLSPGECPVAKGQLIAVSGNTGASSAPHIHMEMYESEGGDMIDPLIFLGKYIKDKKSPLAHGFMVYPQDGEGVFCGSSRKQSVSLSSVNNENKYSAWGKIGFGIWANDYMDGAYNRYGVCKIQLVVDGKTVFESNVDRVPQNMTRIMDYCGDYEHFIKTGIWYMKSYVEPGNHLPIYDIDSNRGYVIFKEKRDYHISYIITDFWGNSNKYNFVVKGVPYKNLRKQPSNQFCRILWDRVNNIKFSNVQLTLKPYSLTQNKTIFPIEYKQSEKLSHRYSFNGMSLPLIRYARISIKCNRSVKDKNKLYISNSYGIPRNFGGNYKDGWVTGFIRDIGDCYEIKYDDTPPVIVPVKKETWTFTQTVRFHIYDNGCGLKQCYGYIDNKPVVLDGVSNKGLYVCNLKNYIIKTNKNHKMDIVAIDNKNNKKIYTVQVKY